MSTKMLLPMEDIPGVIRESVRAVLSTHELDVVPRRDGRLLLDGAKAGVPLDEAMIGKLVSDMGNNATQGLWSIDESLQRYQLGFAATFELRRAYQANGLTDVDLLGAILALEHGEGTATDVADLCHLAELAGLPWREMFPDVIPETGSPELPPSSAANEERDGASTLPPANPQPAPSRSGCMPSTADLLAVGETLRALAQQQRPNPDTAEVLARVGAWLADTARAGLAKGAKAA